MIRFINPAPLSIGGNNSLKKWSLREEKYLKAFGRFSD
jgi:hypothetical protein